MDEPLRDVGDTRRRALAPRGGRPGPGGRGWEVHQEVLATLEAYRLAV
jgi:hypothetical protein